MAFTVALKKETGVEGFCRQSKATYHFCVTEVYIQIMAFLSIGRLIFTKNPLDIYSFENKYATHKGVIKMDKICTFSGAYGGGKNDPEQN